MANLAEEATAWFGDRVEEDARQRGAGAAPGAPAGAGAGALAELRRLAAAAQRGEPQARDELLLRLEPVVQGAARRAAAFARRRGAADLCEVDDLLQEARLALLSLLSGWQAGKGDPLPFFIVRLRARLQQYVVARIRRRPPGRRLSWEAQPAQDLAERLAQRRFAEAEGWRAGGMDGALHQALDRLSPRARRVLYLFYWRDLTDEEIGSVLRLGPKAARQVRYRAEAALRRGLLEAGVKAPPAPRGR